MIKKVTVYQKPDKSDAFTMVLTDPTNVSEKTGFAIDSIDGIGPVEADINTTEMVVDGDLFNSSRIGKRNIILDLIFYSETGTGIEDVRQKSYKLFPTKKLVYVEIETDNRTLWTKGYVEKNEPDIFQENESTQVSIICPDPKMYSVEGQEETLTIGNTTVEYEGEVEVGTVIIFTVGSTIEKPVAQGVPAFTISCSKPNGSTQSIDIFTPSNGFHAGDTITISSVTGDKYAIWTEDGTDVDHNALHLISQNPDWITLEEGENNIQIVDADSALSSVTMTNSICFEGV